jgi:hypothetical protein
MKRTLPEIASDRSLGQPVRDLRKNSRLLHLIFGPERMGSCTVERQNDVPASSAIPRTVRFRD